MTTPSDEDMLAAKEANKHLQRAIYKLKEALYNEKIRGLMITDKEVAAILLALGKYGEDDTER